MQKELYKLCFILILPINITMAQNNAFDVQHLIRCYNSICENRNNETAKAYFEAFPATFEEFRIVFGYEEFSSDVFGDLYSESLNYITEFFSLNTDINCLELSNKIIKICINGEWQADGVNYFQANVINIITSSNQDCYYNNDFLVCYSDTLRELFLSTLQLYTDDEILSFWEFYLEGVRAISFEDKLYFLTKNSIQDHSVLVKQLDKAYFLVKSHQLGNTKR